MYVFPKKKTCQKRLFFFPALAKVLPQCLRLSVNSFTVTVRWESEKALRNSARLKWFGAKHLWGIYQKHLSVYAVGYFGYCIRFLRTSCQCLRFTPYEHVVRHSCCAYLYWEYFWVELCLTCFSQKLVPNLMNHSVLSLWYGSMEGKLMIDRRTVLVIKGTSTTWFLGSRGKWNTRGISAWKVNKNKQTEIWLTIDNWKVLRTFWIVHPQRKKEWNNIKSTDSSHTYWMDGIKWSTFRICVYLFN